MTAERASQPESPAEGQRDAWAIWGGVAAMATAGAAAGYALAAPDSVPVMLPVGAACIASGLLLLGQRSHGRTLRDLERKVQDAERQVKDLTDAASAVVWTASEQGEMQRNAEWKAFTGQDDSDVKQLGWLHALHPDDRDRVVLTWTTAIARKQPFVSEHRVRRADGQYRHMMARARPASADTTRSDSASWLGVHIDITGQRADDVDAPRSDEYVHRILNHLYAFVGVLTPDGTVIMANEAPLKAAGISSADVLGRPFWDCYWWNWSPAVQDRLKKAVALAATGVSSRYDAEVRVARGALITIDFMLSPARDSEGNITHLIPSGVDVSDRKQAERVLAEREQFYRQLIEGMPLLTWTCLPDGTCDYASSRWEQYAGQDADFRGGFTTLDHIHQEDRATVSRAWRTGVATGRAFQAEWRMRRHDGVYRWFACYVTPLRNMRDEIVKWCGTGIDIDDRKQMEEALRDSESRLKTVNSTLEKRVRERTAEVVARSDQLRALALDLAETESRERKRLAQILHDHFQQLVSAAKLKAGLLRRKTEEQTALKALRDIESLLEEAINASRSVATQLSPPVLHDGGLVAALQWLIRKMEQDHQLVIGLETQGECEPDNEQVRTILFECTRELLFNVRKHAGVDAATLRLEQLPEGLLRIEVEDAGKGFEALKLERHRSSDSFGLFSIRERLGLIGGLLSVHSAPGEGTRVQMSVPCVHAPVRGEPVEEAAAMPAPIEAPDAASRKLRVVVADDHAIFREGLVALLMQEPNVEVVAQAGDGVEAVELARQYRPDVMIVDISMPRMNGVQVTSTISHELPDIRIIGLSMYEQEDMAKAMLDAGAVAYCAKSGSPDDTILTYLRSAKKQTSHA